MKFVELYGGEEYLNLDHVARFSRLDQSTTSYTAYAADDSVIARGVPADIVVEIMKRYRFVSVDQEQAALERFAAVRQ